MIYPGLWVAKIAPTRKNHPKERDRGHSKSKSTFRRKKNLNYSNLKFSLLVGCRRRMMSGPSSIMGDRKRCHLGPSGIKDIVIFCSTGTSNCIEPQMGNYVKLWNPKVTDYFDALEIEIFCFGLQYLDVKTKHNLSFEFFHEIFNF